MHIIVANQIHHIDVDQLRAVIAHIDYAINQQRGARLAR